MSNSQRHSYTDFFAAIRRPAMRYVLQTFLTLLLMVSSTLGFTQGDQQASKASAVAVYQSEQLADELIGNARQKKLYPAAARTPLDAILGFRKFLRQGDTATAGQYLDMRYVPDEVAEIEAAKLGQALAFVWIQQNVLDFTAISDSPEGHLDDDLPAYRDKVGEVQLADGVVPVYVQRVPDGEGGSVWRISNATVALIPRMWEEHGYSDFAIWLSAHLPTFNVLGMNNWQAVSALIALITLWYVAGFLTRLISWTVTRFPSQITEGIERFFHVPFRLISYVLLFRYVIGQLGLSVTAKVYLESSPLEYIATTVLILGLITLWRDYKLKQLSNTGDMHLAALLKPMVLIIKIFVALSAFLTWAHNAGFNISTLIAGLGVGSLAVALAAQRTMENVIGAITLYTARPIRPGDFCRFGEIKGTVEEIGLRSVTLRTLDRTLVSIPNAKFSADQVENISVRDRIRYFRQLQLQMPTSNQLRVILGELREMLASHTEVQQDTISVRLETIEAATAVLRIDAGITTQDYQTYLAIAEDLNLRLIEIVHRNGAIFSGPGQVLQLREFFQADLETMSAVEGQLKHWESNGTSPFPDIPEQRKEVLKGSLVFPPKDSTTE